jgi:SAM-dependent methyltransferase
MNLHTNVCVCGSESAASRLFETRDHNFRTTTETTWVMKCRECGSLYPGIFPSVTSLGEAYESYYTQPKTRRGLRRLLRSLIDASRASHILRSTPKSAHAVLDYGCGSGEYLNLLAEEGYEAVLYGTDITRPQSKGNEVFKWISLSDYDKAESQYDWITLSHVLEHLIEPKGVLLRLRSCCTDDGGIWLSTPNADSFLISSFQGHARDVDFPRHRQIYSRQALIQLLSACGYNVTPLPSPRIDELMNYASCARNVMHDSTISLTRKTRILGTSLVHLILHLIKPAVMRTLDSPEIVVVATSSANSFNTINVRQSDLN